jgi:hypothetical protein
MDFGVLIERQMKENERAFDTHFLYTQLFTEKGPVFVDGDFVTLTGNY